MVRVVILAAGHSTRMGSPKALTMIAGTTALARLVRACEAAGLGRPIVVVGRDADLIRGRHLGLDVEYVVNPDPDAGRTGSLKRGLAPVSGGAVLVAPIDHPLVASATLSRIAAEDAAVVVPTFRGRGGHPILLAGDALAEVLALADDAPLRQVVARVPERVVRVAIEDEGVLLNLDTPADVERALARGRFG